MHRSSRSFLTVLVALLPLRMGLCQDPIDPTPPTRAEVEKRISELEALEPVDTIAVETYRKALVEIRNVEITHEKTAEFEALRSQAPALIESLRSELAEPLPNADPAVPKDISLDDLQALVENAETDRDSAKQQTADLAAETAARTERLNRLQAEIAAARNLVDQKDTAVRGAPTATDTAGEARRALLLTELEALRAREQMLVAEKASYEARRDLLPLRRDRADRRRARAEQVAEKLRERLTAAQRDAAEASTSTARRQREQWAQQFPALRPLLESIESLTTSRTGTDEEPGVLTESAEMRDALVEIDTRIGQTRSRAYSTSRRVEAGGLSDGIGRLLRREFEWVRPSTLLKSGPSEPQSELSQDELERFELEDERDSRPVLANAQRDLLAALRAESGNPDEPLDQSTVELVALLTVQEEKFRDQLIGDLSTLSEQLSEWIRKRDLLERLTDEYRQYIEERILWVPSTGNRIVPDFGKASDGIASVISPSTWSRILVDVERGVGLRPLAVATPLLVVLILIVFRRTARRRLEVLNERIRSFKTDRYIYTVETVLLICLVTLPGPLLLWTFGRMLELPAEPDPLARGVGLATREVAVILYTLVTLLYGMRNKGLVEAHFRWPHEPVAVLRRNLRWFIPAICATLFISQAFDQLPTPVLNDSIGRLAFLGAMVSLVLFIYRVLRPGSSVLSDHFQRTQSLLSRTQRAWYLMIQIAPVVLIVMALLGYLYTAHLLEARLRYTIGLLLALVLVNALALRALFIQRRRLAIERARQRVQVQAAPSGEKSNQARELGAVQVDEESLDIPAIDLQSRQLIRSGIFATALIGILLIWADTFPALNAFDRVTLWSIDDISSTAPSSESSTPASGLSPLGAVAASATADSTDGATNGVGPASTDPTTPVVNEGLGLISSEAVVDSSKVSLADLLAALLVLGFTVILVRNAPGLLEIAVLQRLPLDSGSRYALTTLSRYVMLIVGVSIGFGTIHIGWDTIQWLAAALTFGLAFGLQEIFANFVSGIIILIERPIRVGDMVTVNDTEGRVTRLRMRATTILDWDRRELLIPNKEFITGTVVNWTLSDPVTRIIIPVGVAYGSDTALARSLLMKVADEHELVLKTPKPSAIFRRFGDSTLDFDLRVFMQDRDLWPAIMDGLHTAIDNAFREHGVEIAFPQRDLHIRSAKGLEQLRGADLSEPVSPS